MGGFWVESGMSRSYALAPKHGVAALELCHASSWRLTCDVADAVQAGVLPGFGAAGYTADFGRSGQVPGRPGDTAGVRVVL